MNRVRVRFAPSPTGYLHVGGARTALFNWLFARHHHGDFILRIEDTDLARSTEQSVQGILEGMEFLNLDWDEGPGKDSDYGPYFQSQRLDTYRKFQEKLVESGRAYYCFCTPEELDEMREKARQENKRIGYDGRCRELSAAEVEANLAAGKPHVIRFKAEQTGSTIVEDMIRGRVEFENALLDDFVIVKSDGMPTYNFAAVVDDGLMQISHIIRGEDHLSNTPKQIQIYQALGFELPKFAHIPMILGPDKTRLSKRHGATSVTQFRDEGFLPEAMVNYLALLGWSYDDSQTIFSVSELIEKFSLEKISKNPAVFDMKKLEWMNGVYIREMPLEDLLERALPFWQRAGCLPLEPSEAEMNRAIKVLGELQARIRRLDELVDASYYFFIDELRYDEKALRKILFKPEVPEILARLLQGILEADSFNQASLEPIFRQVQEEMGKKLGDVIQPVRVAVTGTNVSPGIYEVLEILGRARTCQRIKEAAAMAKKHLAAEADQAKE